MKHAAWIVLLFGLLALPASVAVCADDTGSGSGAAGEGRHRPPPPPGVIGKFILDHAKDLNLTEDQKQKIEAWLKEHHHEGAGRAAGTAGKPAEGAAKTGEGRHPKGPFADILTEEQHAKLREMLKAEHPHGPPPPAGGGQHPQQ